MSPKLKTYMWYARAFGDLAITQQIGLFEVYAYLRRHHLFSFCFAHSDLSEQGAGKDSNRRLEKSFE